VKGKIIGHKGRRAADQTCRDLQGVGRPEAKMGAKPGCLVSTVNSLVLFWAVSPYCVAMKALEVVIPRSDLCDEESPQILSFK